MDAWDATAVQQCSVSNAWMRLPRGSKRKSNILSVSPLSLSLSLSLPLARSSASVYVHFVVHLLNVHIINPGEVRNLITLEKFNFKKVVLNKFYVYYVLWQTLQSRENAKFFLSPLYNSWFCIWVWSFLSVTWVRSRGFKLLTDILAVSPLKIDCRVQRRLQKSCFWE